jgi:hypothetical protein
VIEQPETSAVRLFFGSVEVENAASIACVRRAGFRLRSPRPVFEGMLHFSFER